MFEAPAAVQSRIRRRVREIQASWSASERQQRWQEGQRRRRQLLEMLELTYEPELWAIGAPGLEDSPRIAS